MKYILFSHHHSCVVLLLRGGATSCGQAHVDLEIVLFRELASDDHQ